MDNLPYEDVSSCGDAESDVTGRRESTDDDKESVISEGCSVNSANAENHKSEDTRNCVQIAADNDGEDSMSSESSYPKEKAASSPAATDAKSLSRGLKKRSLDNLHKKLLRRINPDLDSKLNSQSPLPDFLSESADSMDSMDKAYPKSDGGSSTMGDNIPIDRQSNDREGSRDTSSKMPANLSNSSIQLDKQASERKLSSSVTPGGKGGVAVSELNLVKEKGLYQCAVKDCVRAFNHESDFINHAVQIHSGVKEAFPCPFCFDDVDAEGATSEGSKLSAHLKSHVQNLVRCSLCAAMHETKEEFARHFNTDHPGLPKKFNVCVKIHNNARRKAEKAQSMTTDKNSSKESVPTVMNASTLSAGGTETLKADIEDSSVHDATKKNKIASEESEKCESNSSEPDSKADSEVTQTTEQTRSRKTRKSAKPVRIDTTATAAVEVGNATVDIQAATSMSVKCDLCTYECNNGIEIQRHVEKCHGSGNTGGGAFVCRICKMTTNDKSEYREHMSHHPGNHALRRYVCPYCPEHSSNMDVIEDHIGDKHPSEAFRFEVQQEVVCYMEGMLTCPVCKGAYLWKESFLKHIAQDHQLIALIDYLQVIFAPLAEGAKDTGKVSKIDGVPRDLFEDQLEPPREIKVEEDDVEIRKDGWESGEVALNTDNDIAEEYKPSLEYIDAILTDENAAVSTSTPLSGAPRAKILFRCDLCEFVGNNFEEYTDHMNRHETGMPHKAAEADGAGCDSIIRKLLTSERVQDISSSSRTDTSVRETDESSFDTSMVSMNNSDLSSQRPEKSGRSKILYCHLCPFSTIKSVHYRRHLEIHAKNETIVDGYKCGYCQFRHPKLNCIKFHLGKYHGDQPNRMYRIIDGEEIDISGDDFPAPVRPSRAVNKTGLTAATEQTGGAVSTLSLVLRGEGEKRPVDRYEPVFTQRSPSKSRPLPGDRAKVERRDVLVDRSIVDPLLIEFERSLSTQMIYSEPVKCPRCEFTNRVRINILRHLRQHREDGGFYEDSYDMSLGNGSVSSSSKSRQLGSTNAQEAPKRSGSLLHDILTEKLDKTPVIVKEEPAYDADEGDEICEEDEGEGEEGMDMEEDSVDFRTNADGRTRGWNYNPVTMSTISSDFLDYSVRLSKDRYQCRECPFVHRYPSKVKRHYFYRHSRVLPYRCGYCLFEAVESGKVRKHSLIIHKNKSVMVLRQRAVALDSSSSSKVMASFDEQSSQEGEDSQTSFTEQETSVEVEEPTGNVRVINEMISAEKGDKRGDRWFPQFVTRQDGLKAQVCKLCGFSGETVVALKRHVYERHLRNYPYSCQYCGMATTETERVKKHIDRCHSGRPYIAVFRVFEDDRTAESHKQPVASASQSSPVPPSIEAQPSFESSSNDNNQSTSSWSLSAVKQEPKDCDVEEDAPQIDFYPTGSTAELSADADDLLLETEREEEENSLKRYIPMRDRDPMTGRFLAGPPSASNPPPPRVESPEEEDPSKLKRQFRCAYCGVVSRWNRRDIRLHVLHVHMRRRVYTCRHCSFGNSKSRAIVRTHCGNVHPNRPVSIRDDVSILNLITPIEDKRGTITVAFARPDGHPIIDPAELIDYLSEFHPIGSPKSRRPSRIEDTAEQSVAAELNDDLDREVTRSWKLSDYKVDMSVGGESSKGSTMNENDDVRSVSDCADVTQSQQDDWLWKCTQCGLVDASEERVKRHIICYHLKLRPLGCPYCSARMWRENAVETHIAETHPGREFYCVTTAKEKKSEIERCMEKVPATRKKAEADSGKKETGRQIDNKSDSVEMQPRGGMSESEVSGHYSEKSFDKSRLAEGFVKGGINSSGLPNIPAMYRCRICGYEDPRNDKTKYHLVKGHLGLRQFSCPYCGEYMWGRHQVVKHIEEVHPGQEVRVQRTFQEYDEYLRENILKIGGVNGITAEEANEIIDGIGFMSSDEKHDNLKERNESMDMQEEGRFENSDDEDDMDDTVAGTTAECKTVSPLKIQFNFKTPKSDGLKAFNITRLPCDVCSFVTDTEISLAAHKRTHRLFECLHCCYKHALVTNVQAHSRSEHPSLPIKYRQCPASGAAVSAPLEDEDDLEDDTAFNEVVQNIKTEAKSPTELQPTFYPCDLCPAHFKAESDLDSHLSRDHAGVYICNVCSMVKWKREDMRVHVQRAHPSVPNASFEMKRKSDGIKRPAPDTLAGPNTKEMKVTTSQMSGDGDTMYQCRTCEYRTFKLTVMRHHVMAHIRYHPYQCPYCSAMRAVKSFPIMKHVRAKHPGLEAKFYCTRDEKMERLVKSSYFRIAKDGTDSSNGQYGSSHSGKLNVSPVTQQKYTGLKSNPSQAGRASPTKPRTETVSKSAQPLKVLPSQPSVVQRNVLYQCTFCSLRTHIRTDMRHHLMREIRYKPYKCSLCPYTEPCKWSMRKHFRIRHAGQEVGVECFRDADKELLVESMVEECAINLKLNREVAAMSMRPVNNSSPGSASSRTLSASTAMSTTEQVRYDSLGRVIPRRQPFSATSTWLKTKKLKRRKGSGRAAGLKMSTKIHKCPHCPYNNSNLKLVRGHLVKHGPHRFQCGYCDYTGHYPSRITKHMRRHHPKQPFKCIKINNGIQIPGEIETVERINPINQSQRRVEDSDEAVYNHQPSRIGLRTQPGVVLLDGRPVDVPTKPVSA